MNESSIAQWQRMYDIHCTLAQEAEEKGWTDALRYHREMAQEYLTAIETFMKQREEAEDAEDV